jgi:hypothetical protein
MRALGVLKSRDPQCRAKIAAARRGKARPPHVLEAMHEARRGSQHSEETRRRMREAHRKRGTLVPGTADEAAKKTGRSLRAVYARHRRLGMPDGRRRDRIRRAKPAK